MLHCCRGMSADCVVSKMGARCMPVVVIMFDCGGTVVPSNERGKQDSDHDEECRCSLVQA